MADATRKSLTIPGGPKYSYIYQVAENEKPTFLLLHGFPSSSYDWRKQIANLSKAGYGVVAPDLLGYGETAKPEALEAYAFSNLAGHVSEILKHENLTTVIGVGHDWGSVVLSKAWNYYPQYFSALVFASVGYQLPGPFNLAGTNALTESLFGYTMFGYWNFFNETDAASLLQSHHESFSTIMYQSDPEIWKTDFCPIGKLREWVTANKTAPLPSWLPRNEFEEHKKILEKGGYTGPLNWYKGVIRDIDHEKDATISAEAKVINKPTIFLVGESDAVTRPEVAIQAAGQGKTEGWLPNVEVKTVPGSHWFYLEQPEATFEILDNLAKSL
ncbi:epoxide hydrolase [Byssothecium circinans]|uniref:Epoxide hydrolase n=1 Tax=Byssothecium circinans TaxID=147558 RepID=A0A6A5TDR4_9PLEO|nr:epoxide hydrolase [Byssothecium circinans]